MRATLLALIIAAALALTLMSIARNTGWANGSSLRSEILRLPVSGSTLLPNPWRSNGAMVAAPYMPRLRVPAEEHRWPLLIGEPAPPVQIPSPESVHVEFAGDRSGR
jgi:hypothetical protein